MRDHTSGQFVDLLYPANPTAAITPGSSVQQATATIAGLPPVTGKFKNYARGIQNHLNVVVDPDAGGNAVNADKLGKVMSSFEVTIPTFGVIFPAQHTRGAVAYHVIQILGLGYRAPYGYGRTQIPASTDTDVTIDLYYWLPIAHDCLAKAHETSQWVGFYQDGTVQQNVDVSTVLDGDYAGAVTKTGTLRSQFHYFSSPDDFIGVPVQHRERVITGGGDSPLLQNMGSDTALVGVKGTSGIAAMLWLTDATGIGLAGPDGVDNFTSMEIPWRGQKQVKNLDAFFQELLDRMPNRVAPVSGIGASTPINNGAGWPFTMAATVDNRPASNSQALFLPLVVPGEAQETSKIQNVSGSFPAFNSTATSTPSTSHRIYTMELMEFTEQMLLDLAQRAGFSGEGKSKELRTSEIAQGEDGKLRFTRTVFPKAA